MQHCLAEVLRGQSVLTERLRVVPELIVGGPRGPQSRGEVKAGRLSCVFPGPAAHSVLGKGSGVCRPLAPAGCK